MPNTSTEPNEDNALAIGDLIVFHSDNGGYGLQHREQVVVIDLHDKRHDGDAAMWKLYQELVKLNALPGGVAANVKPFKKSGK